MAGEGSRAIAKQLGGRPPAGVVKALDEAELIALSQLIHGARKRQTAAVRAAGDRALNHLPWIVRGPVKKIVGMSR